LKIQILSDLHFEFERPDQEKAFINSLDPSGIDVLVLAGDITSSKRLLPTMNLICKRYSDAKVLWVHGNHVFYSSTRNEVVQKTNQAIRENENLFWLDNTMVVIDGQRFIGGPMWFDFKQDNFMYHQWLNDFSQIKDDYDVWVYNENSKFKDFLRNNAQSDDIIISHHLPHNKSVASRFIGSELNRFFVCDMQSEIHYIEPKIWIHGHTHFSLDYEIPTESGSKTRIVANPRGYAHMNENSRFNKDFSIVV